MAKPGTTGGVEFPTTWDALRAGVSELERLSEMYLADACALEHEDRAGIDTVGAGRRVMQEPHPGRFPRRAPST